MCEEDFAVKRASRRLAEVSMALPDDAYNEFKFAVHEYAIAMVKLSMKHGRDLDRIIAPFKGGK